MRNDASISENFWKEFEARGFSLEKESGGVKLKEYNEAKIKKCGQTLYQLVTPDNTARITVIEARLFLETVKKIENIVNFKLFE